jgi:NADH-quinone oxidoreductase subunit L
MRQIGMTFLGQPRTRAARHAVESHWTMWLPLVVLAAFTLIVGYLGVHPDFPLLGALFSSSGESTVHSFVAPLVLEEVLAPGFNGVAVLISILAVFSGLGLGYWVYVMRGVRTTDQRDWVEGIVGSWIYNEVLSRKYRLDDSIVGGVYKEGLYTRLFVRPAWWLSERLSYQLIDRTIIDGALAWVGRISTQVGNFFRSFNSAVIDGVGDGIPIGIGRFAAWFRPIQSGKVQQYLLIVALSTILIGVVLVLMAAR